MTVITIPSIGRDLVEECGLHLADVAGVHVPELRRVERLFIPYFQLVQVGDDRVGADPHPHLVGPEAGGRGFLLA